MEAEAEALKFFFTKWKRKRHWNLPLPKRCLKPHRPHLRPQRPGLSPWPGLKPQRLGLRLQRPDLGRHRLQMLGLKLLMSGFWAQNPGLWLLMPGLRPQKPKQRGGRTDRRTDIRTKFSLFHRTSVPSGAAAQKAKTVKWDGPTNLVTYRVACTRQLILLTNAPPQQYKPINYIINVPTSRTTVHLTSNRGKECSSPSIKIAKSTKNLIAKVSWGPETNHEVRIKMIFFPKSSV